MSRDMGFVESRSQNFFHWITKQTLSNATSILALQVDLTQRNKKTLKARTKRKKGKVVSPAYTTVGGKCGWFFSLLPFHRHNAPLICFSLRRRQTRKWFFQFLRKALSAWSKKTEKQKERKTKGKKIIVASHKQLHQLFSLLLPTPCTPKPLLLIISS